MQFFKSLSAVSLVSAVFATQAAADPAILYELGSGKFDKSYNEAAYNGAKRWKEAGEGRNYIEFELQNDAQRMQALRRFAAQGANPIIMAGYSWVSAVETVAPEFPDTNFVTIDATVDLPNVKSVEFDQHIGSFLVGAAAALKTGTGTVGFVGGMDIPNLRAFSCGYKQGIHAVNPDTKLLISWVGTTASAWNDPVTASELARAMIDDGADVVYAAAAGSSVGVLQTMKDAGLYSIGVDSNQNWVHPGSVLTSMMKRVDVAVYDAMSEWSDGKPFQAGSLRMNLQNNGVDYAMDEHNKGLLTDERIAEIEALKAKVISGEIVVHDFRTDGQCPV